jgi:hypothetical protein
MRFTILDSVPTFLGCTHLRFNGVYQPWKMAVERLRSAVVPILVRTRNDGWPQDTRGTGFLLQKSGRRFCIFTKHQLLQHIEHAAVEPGDIYLPLGEGFDTLYSGGRYTERLSPTDPADDGQFIAIEVSSPTADKDKIKNFFEASPANFTEPAVENTTFVIGYPSILTEIMIDDVGTLKSLSHRQYLARAASFEKRAGSLGILRLRVGDELTAETKGNFDGFSGAPVFSVRMQSQSIEFLGLVARGGNGYFYVAPRQWVEELIVQAMAQPPLAG